MTRPRCGNDPRAQLTDGDRQAVADFKAYLADRAALRDRIADALATADGWVFAPGFKEGSPTYQGFLRQADAVLAVLPEPAPTTEAAEEADVDTVANRAAQVISSMGADIRALTQERDRYRTAWHSARRRASVLSAEITRRAPLLGEYAAQIANLRTMCEVSIARENDLIEERDQLREARADRAAVLREAADAVFALDYDEMVSEQDDENLGSMREAWDLGTIHATQLLRRLADETQPAEGGPGCAHCGGDHSWDTCEAYTALVADETPAAPPQRDETLPAGATPMTVYLATPCDACDHTLNWHRNDVGCTVPRCVCGRFQEPAAGARQDGANR